MKDIYHSGEIAVQERAGVRGIAERVGQSIVRVIPSRVQEFVRAQPMAILGTIDADGRPWASLLTGAPGFMSVVDERMLRIEARAGSGDPLRENLQRTTDVGVLIIELSTRRRMRLNGRMYVDRKGFVCVQAEQVYSNCRKYIRAREWEIDPSERESPPGQLVERTHSLTLEQRQWVAKADTFFIASYHPQASADASHRGGAPGFVRVRNSKRLTWADYPGNSMFQTLGNIWSYPRAGLLFIDFEAGDSLQLTGTAEVVWEETHAGEPGDTERSVVFEIDEVVHTSRATNLRWHLLG